jgi:methylmalonyl-CoA mutase C-terminal domain/subunit
VLDEIKERAGTMIPVFVGGIIPQEDIALLKEAGVAEVFTPGTSTAQIADAISGIVKKG